MKGLPNDDVLAGIRLLLLDVDGVLTDGRLHFDASGKEVKTFHVHDGAGLVYWHRCGGISGFLSGRRSDVVVDRGRQLGVQELHLGHHDKKPVYADILERNDLRHEQVAYVGDDLLDLPVLDQVGFAVTVPNARPEVKERVHYVTHTPGGEGAVREVVELLLKARGLWEDVVRRGGLP